MTEIKKTWGGKRKGAGRPASGKATGKVYTFRLNPTEARIVDSQKNRSEFVRECIMRSVRKEPDFNLLSMLCPNPESCYLIRVQGDSMIDADIHSGDILIVDKSNRNPDEHQVAVCEYNGEYTLKRIKITPEDNFRVWGTVTYIIHKPRE